MSLKSMRLLRRRPAKTTLKLLSIFQKKKLCTAKPTNSEHIAQQPLEIKTVASFHSFADAFLRRSVNLRVICKTLALSRHWPRTTCRKYVTLRRLRLLDVVREFGVWIKQCVGGKTCEKDICKVSYNGAPSVLGSVIFMNKTFRFF